MIFFWFDCRANFRRICYGKILNELFNHRNVTCNISIIWFDNVNQDWEVLWINGYYLVFSLGTDILLQLTLDIVFPTDV